MQGNEEMRREFAAAGARARLFAVKSYPRYLWYGIRESTLYRRMVAVWVNFRRYRLVSRIITVIATILTVMGTGAGIFLFSLLCLLVLPPLALAAGGTMLLGIFGRRRQTQVLETQWQGRTVYLIFPGEIRQRSFSATTILELSTRPQSVVFVISPYAWSTRGLGGRGFYLNARREAEHLYLLRRHYFFFFRRALLADKCKRIVVIL